MRKEKVRRTGAKEAVRSAGPRTRAGVARNMRHSVSVVHGHIVVVHAALHLGLMKSYIVSNDTKSDLVVGVVWARGEGSTKFSSVGDKITSCCLLFRAEY